MATEATEAIGATGALPSAPPGYDGTSAKAKYWTDAKIQRVALGCIAAAFALGAAGLATAAAFSAFPMPGALCVVGAVVCGIVAAILLISCCLIVDYASPKTRKQFLRKSFPQLASHLKQITQSTTLTLGELRGKFLDMSFNDLVALSSLDYLLVEKGILQQEDYTQFNAYRAQVLSALEAKSGAEVQADRDNRGRTEVLAVALDAEVNAALHNYDCKVEAAVREKMAQQDFSHLKESQRAAARSAERRSALGAAQQKYQGELDSDLTQIATKRAFLATNVEATRQQKAYASALAAAATTYRQKFATIGGEYNAYVASLRFLEPSAPLAEDVEVEKK